MVAEGFLTYITCIKGFSLYEFSDVGLGLIGHTEGFLPQTTSVRVSPQYEFSRCRAKDELS